MAKPKASKPSKGGKQTATKSKTAKAGAAASKAKASAKGAKSAAKVKTSPKKQAAPAPKRKAAARSRGKAASAALSAEQKQRLLKPLTNFVDLVERLAGTWSEHGRAVRVPGLTAAKLSSLLRRAEAASKKEEAVRARLEARLRPLADARLVAEHEVWKAALDVYAMAKAAARTDPGILTPFDFFAEALQKRRSGDAGAGPKEAPAEG